MGTLTNPYTYAAGSYAVAAQVNASFATLYGWVNTNGVWADASRAFTAVPTGPNTDPSAPNHLARKAYVDALGAARVPTSLFAVNGAAHNGSGNNGILIQGGNVDSGTTNSGGGFSVTFGRPFPTGCFSVVASANDTAVGNWAVQIAHSPAPTASGFQGRIYDPATNAGIPSVHYVIGYIALGT